MSMKERVYVIYDGQCRFCIRSLKLFSAADIFKIFRFYDAHDEPSVAALFPELHGADFDNAMFVVTERRAVYRGFFAFRRMIWSSPLLWPLIPVFYPIFDFAAKKGLIITPRAQRRFNALMVRPAGK